MDIVVSNSVLFSHLNCSCSIFLLFFILQIMVYMLLLLACLVIFGCMADIVEFLLLRYWGF